MIIEPRQATGKECCENCIHGIKTDIDNLIDCEHDGRSKDCDLVCDEYGATFDCINRTRKDALELLDKQVPKRPYFNGNVHQCGNNKCRYVIEYGNRFCRGCGQAVKWE